MKNLIKIIVLLFFANTVNGQIVNIPDPIFKARLLAASATDPQNQIAQNFSDQFVVIDTNNDGEIQVAEAQIIKLLIVAGSNITDLTGLTSFSSLDFLSLRFLFLNSLNLNSFTSLKQLSIYGMVNLNSLNINNLTSLTKLVITSTDITNFSISNLTNLTKIVIADNYMNTLNLNGLSNLTKLNCSSNTLTNLTLVGLTSLSELDCSGNKLISLNGLSTTLSKINCSANEFVSLNFNPLVNLTELDCSTNKLTSLNFTNLPNLVKLDCSRNQLTSIGLNNLNSLSELIINNNLFTTFTVNNLPSLTSLQIGSNDVSFNQSPLTVLNLSNLPNLQKLNCRSGLLTSLNLTNLTSLKELDCGNNNLTSLNLNGLTNLEVFSSVLNPIATIDLSSCPNLIKASCGGSRLIDNQFIGYLQNLNVVGLSNLKELFCSGNILSSLDLTGLNSLEYLDCTGVSSISPGNISSLSINNLSNLKKLYCRSQKITSLNASNLVNLTDLYCDNNLITNLNLNGLINLVNLDYGNNYLTNISLINLPNLKVLGCAYNQLTTLNVLNLTNLETLNCSKNQLTTLNLSGLSNLKSLDFSENQLSLTSISGLSTLLASLNCSFNSLTSIDLTGLNNLGNVNCSGNLLTSLNLDGLNNLISLDCTNNQLTNINLSSLSNLKYLKIDGNQLTNLDISNQTQLFQLNCSYNLLTSLDLISHTNLTFLSYSSNTIPNMDVSFLTNLIGLECDNTQSTLIDVSALTNLGYLSCKNNFLTTIDVSNQTNFAGVYCSNNLLTTLFIKNGKNEQNLDLSGNPTLQYICADDSQLTSIQTQLNSLGMNTTVSNSYCTFTPGGNNNTITGLTIYDDDNNGCDITDEVNPFIRFNISDGTTNGATVTNINGSYTFFTNAGNYTLAPNIENPSWFSFSPTSANIVFPDNNNNISNQNFCINAVGIHNDIEVAFHQTDVARPGFDAPYKIVFKNKGNQMVSGTINLAFNDSKTDFVSSTPNVDMQATNSLTWNYTNLMPFESRSITFNLNINSPVETPAVNIGDILNFVTTINPVTDDISADNTFNYNQTVVGSFDPNSIECLEGETVDPSFIGQYLHYGVNFENTGNYPAENIVVKVIIDTTKYDMNSLQLMDTSHNSYTRITGNVAEFIFETINLDSGGHGNILFKIKTVNNLSDGDIVNKRADIFFDYNAPIDTGMANTTFQSLSNGAFEIDNSVLVYPNPAKNSINIYVNQKDNNKIKSVELYDVQGRLLQTKLVDDLQTSIDISEKSKGIYFLKITSNSGSKVEKFVKE